MINNNITEEIKEKVFKWVEYINNGHYGNARDIVNTYNMVFNNIKQPQAYTSCGSCLKRCVVQMKNEIERNDKELEEEKLNALKELAGIEHSRHVISPEAIEPIQKLKTQYLGSKNPRLHTDEVLIALSVSAATDPMAQLALEQLPNLKGCQAHTSVMVSSVDMKQFKKLSIQATFEAKYEKNPNFINESGV